ncbi:hypothetical protein TWF481_000238 [Arthrobotrys musiformis]|uniref:Pali-domain-containing protein n=1 Tax=Arthrobotrys musiformis TaxID=47236 RepID=A0AAV9WP16_9PEZI
MAKRTFTILHFTATISLIISSILLLIITLSGQIWRDYSLMTVVLKNGSAFEVIPFSRDRDSYVTYGTFGYCIQNIDLGQGYQKQSCSDPTVGYAITEIQTSIDGTKFFENNKGLDSLTKVMILHPIGCVLAFIACLFGARSGYLRSIWSMVLTLVVWVMTTVAMGIELYVFIIMHEHISSKEIGGGSRPWLGPALWSLVVTFIFLTYAVLVTGATVWQKKYWWGGGEAVMVAARKKRGRKIPGRGVNGESDSGGSSPVRRWSRDEAHVPFWKHRREDNTLVFE